MSRAENGIEAENESRPSGTIDEIELQRARATANSLSELSELTEQERRRLWQVQPQILRASYNENLVAKQNQDITESRRAEYDRLMLESNLLDCHAATGAGRAVHTNTSNSFGSSATTITLGV